MSRVYCGCRSGAACLSVLLAGPCLVLCFELLRRPCALMACISHKSALKHGCLSPGRRDASIGLLLPVQCSSITYVVQQADLCPAAPQQAYSPFLTTSMGTLIAVSVMIGLCLMLGVTAGLIRIRQQHRSHQVGLVVAELDCRLRPGVSRSTMAQHFVQLLLQLTFGWDH